MRNVIVLLAGLLVSASACERGPAEDPAADAAGVVAAPELDGLTCELSPASRASRWFGESYVLRNADGLIRYRLDVASGRGGRVESLLVFETAAPVQPRIISLSLSPLALVADEGSGRRAVPGREVKTAPEYRLAALLYAHCKGRSLEAGS